MEKQLILFLLLKSNLCLGQTLYFGVNVLQMKKAIRVVFVLLSEDRARSLAQQPPVPSAGLRRGVGAVARQCGYLRRRLHQVIL